MTTTDGLAGAMAVAPLVGDLLVDGDRRWSSDEVTSASARVAGGLTGHGVGAGTRVAFDAPVAAETVMLYRACWHLGAVAAALHPLAGSAQLDDALSQLDPVVTLARARPSSGSSSAPPDSRPYLVTAEPAPAVFGDPTGAALVLFTSGSSGAPKGVVHSGQALAVKARQLLDVHSLGPADAVLMPAPLAHVSGLLHAVLLPAVGGVKAVLMPRWDPGAALDLIERESITYMVGPPTFFLDLMDHPRCARDRVESLRFLSCGGTGVTPAFVERAGTELGCLVKRSYGSTEAPTVTTSRNDDPVEAMIGTDGRAHGATELRIDDLPAGADGEGEVRVRGPEVATGYLDPAETDAAFEDGWFRTGDRGRLDGGWLTITGRLDDAVIRGGENISAAAVERTVEAHPSVRQAVAVGVPDDRLGQRVGIAVVVDGDDEFDLNACRHWFTDQGVGRLLTPEQVLVVDTIPTLPSGKPDRASVARALSRQ